jgi:hypothetical protein
VYSIIKLQFTSPDDRLPSSPLAPKSNTRLGIEVGNQQYRCYRTQLQLGYIVECLVTLLSDKYCFIVALPGNPNMWQSYIISVVGLHELRVLRKAKRSSVTRLALAGQQQQSLRHYCNVVNEELIRKDYNQKACSWALSIQGKCEQHYWRLRIRKVCARCVPRSPTDDHKTVRKEVCSDLLSRYEADGESLLSRIIAGDETWIHHFEQETKRQSMEWRHPTSPAGRSLRLPLKQGKSWPLLGMQKGCFW